MKKDINEFRTSDLQLTIVLYTLGFPLIGVDKTNPRRASFLFEDDGNISDSVSAFYRGELSLDPRIVLTNAKLVKDRLYGE